MPPEFDWDQANTAHIARHALTPEIVEAVMLDSRRLVFAARTESGEIRWVILGSTPEGLILRVIFTVREQRIRVVTAYRATPAQQRRYVVR